MHSSVFPAVFYNITFQFEYFTYFFSNFFLSTSFSSFSSSSPFLSSCHLTPSPGFHICKPSNWARRACCNLPLSSALGKAGTSHNAVTPSQPLPSLDAFPPRHGTLQSAVGCRNEVFARHQHSINSWGAHKWLSVALAQEPSSGCGEGTA